MLNKMKFLRLAAFVVFLSSVMVNCNRAHAVNLPMYRPSTGVALPPAPLPTPTTYEFGSLYKNVNSSGVVGSGGIYGTLPPAYGNGRLPDLSFVPSSNPTTNNPEAFIPKVVNNAAVLESSITFKAAPPVGATLAGSVATDATLVRDVGLGTGATSLAAAMGKSALGVAGGAAAIFAAPEVIGILLAAQVGMQGYDFYQSLKSQGVLFSSDGSAVQGFVPNTSYKVGGTGGGSGYTSADACAAYAPIYVASISSSVLTSSSVYATAGMTYPNICTVNYTYTPTGALGHPTFSVTQIVGCAAGYVSSGGQCQIVDVTKATPTTQDQLASAIVAGTMSAAAAKDIADVYLNKLQMPLPDTMTVTNAPNLFNVQSPYAVPSTSTDNLGNTISKQSRNEIQGTPSSDTSKPTTFVENNVTNNVTNGTTTNTTTNYIPPTAPVVIPSVSISNPTPTPDLCAQHPEILACADITKLNDVATLDSSSLNKTVNISALTPVAIGGVYMCPAPVVLVTPFGKTMTIDFSSTLCNFASTIKPFNLAAASLFVFFLMFGGTGKGNSLNG